MSACHMSALSPSAARRINFPGVFQVQKKRCPTSLNLPPEGASLKTLGSSKELPGVLLWNEADN